MMLTMAVEKTLYIRDSCDPCVAEVSNAEKSVWKSQFGAVDALAPFLKTKSGQLRMW